MTYEQFLDWLDEDRLAEWVDGEARMVSPASDRHQDVADFLVSVLRSYVASNQLGIVRSAPCQMKLDRTGREPDVLFIAEAHRDRLRPTYLDGPADLAIEIISPESIGRDRGEKFYEYERASIPEYWLIDPETERAEFYQLDASGRYALIPPDEQGRYHSHILPGFWMRVSWLWQPTLPAAEDVLLEVGGDRYASEWIDRLRAGGFLPDK